MSLYTMRYLLISAVLIPYFSCMAGATEPIALNAKKPVPKVQQPEYPAAKNDEERYSITLPPRKNEQNYLVELLFSSKEETDCNILIRHADLTQLSLAGWGYSYYRLGPLSPAMKTLMGCFEPPKIADVAINVSNSFINYNSQLPIVVYAPKNITVKYRLWSTKNQQQLATSF